ncbi:MAG: type II secretion system GspH family protein [Lachnospiraceae bacterium]|nr:type II secretion system GspH family protein [Lachnospiraceae bacterium]
MRSAESKKRRAKSNKGLSLIELLVVIMLISVILGYVAYNVNVVNGYRARKCKNILASQIAELKVRTLSKAVKTGDVYMKVYKGKGSNAKNIYSQVFYKTTAGEEKEEPVLIGSRVGVFYGNSGSEKEILDEENTKGSNGLIITYNRANGSMVESPTSTALSTVTMIKVSANEKVYKLELVPATGKVINKTDLNQ